MKILVLNYEYPPLGGGGATVCRDLAREIVKQGNSLTVVTMSYPGLQAHEFVDGIEIYRIKCMRKKEHACMPWEAYSFILSAEKFLEEYLKNHTFDVCHAHFIIPTGVIALWVKRRFRIPYVLTAHGSDVEGHNRKTYIKIMHRCLRPFWRRIVREAYAVAAPSEYLIKLMNHEMRSRRYIRIPNGIDIDRSKPCKGKKNKQILMMGRLQEAKNFHIVLKAVSLISIESWNSWHVNILGDGPYREELEKLCIQLGIEDRVTFCGWIENGSREQLAHLEKAAVYISASRFENCPMSVIEAMSSGCYPLLSDIDGHRQFFQNIPETNRYFFEADDAHMLAGRLEALVRQGVEGISAVEIDLSPYRLSAVSEKYIRILRKAAGF